MLISRERLKLIKLASHFILAQLFCFDVSSEIESNSWVQTLQACSKELSEKHWDDPLSISSINSRLDESEERYAGRAKSTADRRPRPPKVKGSFACLQPVSSKLTLQMWYLSHLRNPVGGSKGHFGECRGNSVAKNCFSRGRGLDVQYLYLNLEWKIPKMPGYSY